MCLPKSLKSDSQLEPIAISKVGMSKLLTLLAGYFFIQPLLAIEDHYNEASPALVLYTGDSMRSTEMGGLSYTYHMTRSYWVGVDILAGRTQVDSNSGTMLRSGKRYIGVDGAFYLNIPALLGRTESDSSRGLVADLYTSFGVGSLWIDRETEPYGFVGGGMIIHFPVQWLALRFDLKGILFNLGNQSGSDLNSDMALSLGPSLKF